MCMPSIDWMKGKSLFSRKKCYEKNAITMSRNCDSGSELTESDRGGGS